MRTFVEYLRKLSEFKLVQKTISRLPKEAEARDFSHESVHGPEFDFVITNSHTPKPEPKPEISQQKPSKQDPPAKITVKASKIPTGVQSGEAFWLILFCACFSVCVLMLMKQGMKKRKK